MILVVTVFLVFRHTVDLVNTKIKLVLLLASLVPMVSFRRQAILNVFPVVKVIILLGLSQFVFLAKLVTTVQLSMACLLKALVPLVLIPKLALLNVNLLLRVPMSLALELLVL